MACCIDIEEDLLVTLLTMLLDSLFDLIPCVNQLVKVFVKAFVYVVITDAHLNRGTPSHLAVILHLW